MMVKIATRIDILLEDVAPSEMIELYVKDAETGEPVEMEDYPRGDVTGIVDSYVDAARNDNRQPIVWLYSANEPLVLPPPIRPIFR